MKTTRQRGNTTRLISAIVPGCIVFVSNDHVAETIRSRIKDNGIDSDTVYFIRFNHLEKDIKFMPSDGPIVVDCSILECFALYIRELEDKISE